MSLVRWRQSFKLTGGILLKNAGVSVYLSGTSTSARIFDENDILHDEAPQLYTDSVGFVEIKLDPDDFCNGQLFDIYCQPDARCSDDERVVLKSLMILQDTEGERNFKSIFTQASIPTAGMKDDDLWFHTGDNDHLYIYSDPNWVSKRDGTIATAANTANWTTVSGKPIQSSFRETFDDPLTTLDTNWPNYNGSGETSTVASGEAGGYAYQIGNNSGNDMRWIIWHESIPFDPDKLYRLTCRIRQDLGAGFCYLGVAGRNGADDAWVNRLGVDAYSSQHYILAVGTSPGASFVEYTGYIKGTAAEGSDSAHSDPTDPAVMHEDVRYIRPLILVNYSGQAGQYTVDEFTIDSANDNTAASTFVTVTYPADQTDVQDQIDGKIISWFQSSSPQPTWDGTDASHAGDMWWNSNTKKLKRWTGSAWSADIEDQQAIDAYANAATAQDTADGKRRVFTATPTTPYDVGDLWSGGPTGDIKKCKTARASGAYQAGDWELASDYTEGATWGSDITDQPDDALLLNELNCVGGYQEVALPKEDGSPNCIDCYINNSTPACWFKVAEFVLTGDYKTCTWNGLFCEGGSNGRYDKQMRVRVGATTGGAGTIDAVGYKYSGDNLTTVLKVRYTGVTVTFYVSLGTYSSCLFDGAWSCKVAAGNSWIHTKQTHADNIGSDPGGTNISPTANYTQGADITGDNTSDNTYYVNDSETQVAHTFDIYGDLYLKNAADIHFYDVNSNKVATIWSSGATVFVIDSQSNCELSIQSGANLKLLSEDQTSIHSFNSYIGLTSATSYILLNASTTLWVYSDIKTNATTYDIGDGTYYWAKIHANCYYYRGTAGVASYGPANPSSITVRGGIITAIS